MRKKIREKAPEKVWIDFKKQENLTQEQVEKFKDYAALLLEENKKINLTAITSLTGVVRQHFQDSFALQYFVDLKKIKTIADVGAGAGFPSIPLKILYPNLNVILIEVNKKKQKFLSELILALDLQDIQVVDLDWRTFLRTTKFDVDLFVTRAALSDDELCRMFRQTCFYKNKKLVYWGTNDWLPQPKNEEYLKEIKDYKLGKKERKLFFFYL